MGLPLLLVLCAGQVNGNEGAGSDADLFEEIFGTAKSPRPQAIEVPLILDRRFQQEITVTVGGPQEEIRIEAGPFLQAVEEMVRPDILERMRAAVDPRDQVAIADLTALGLEVVFDEQQLELRVAVPAHLRQSSDISLSRRFPPPGMDRALRPSALSAFLNLRTGIDHVQQSSTGGDEGLQPLRADFDGAVNWQNWVAEGQAFYAERGPTHWRRGNARLVRDDPERRIRYSAGDLVYPTTGFQTFQPMAGLTVARNFALQPYRVTEPRGHASFFLNAPSTVEVLVNGRPVRTLQLPAGPHNLQDFVFASGGNDVLLRITDDVGRVETLQLSFFFDPRLLAAGEHEFSYSAGIPAHPGEWGPEYDRHEPVFSLFHRAGLTDAVTAGLNLQGNEDQQVFGAEALWATSIGTFQPDVAVSCRDEGRDGYAARLGYRFQNASHSWRSTWSFSAQYLDPHFGSLGNLDPANPVAWHFAGRYSQPLPWEMSGGIGGTYQIRRETPDTLSGANLFVAKRFGRSGTADLTLDWRETTAGETEQRAFISFTYLFPERRHRLRTTHDTFSRTSRADLHYTSRKTVGGIDGNLGIQRRPGDYSAYGGAHYAGYRGEANLFHELTTPVTADARHDSRTRFQFGTALVYADGQFALSRPVHDSFAMVKAHPDFRDQKIGVDPLREGRSAEINRWGPAVVPDLASYQVRNVSIEAPELSPGYELGPGFYSVWPTYKSGTIIEVGTGATVLLAGVVESGAGTPVSLQFGEIVPLSEAEAGRVEFFTNRVGKFSVEGLRPGRYEMHLFTDPPTAVQFEIPKGEAGIYDIGNLRVREAAVGKTSVQQSFNPESL